MMDSHVVLLKGFWCCGQMLLLRVLMRRDACCYVLYPGALLPTLPALLLFVVLSTPLGTQLPPPACPTDKRSFVCRLAEHASFLWLNTHQHRRDACDCVPLTL